MKKLLLIIALFAFTDSFVCSAQNQDEEAIRQVVQKYIRSIDNCDTTLVNQIWSHNDNVSFIAPSGYYKTYNEIRDRFVIGIFGTVFKERHLISRDLKINVNGNLAWIEFSWDFNAIRVDNGQIHSTKGLETQIMQKDAAGEWKLMHVHYSAQ